MFYCMEVENDTFGAPALISVAGVGETAQAAQEDAMAYLARIDPNAQSEAEAKDWDYWRDCASDAGFMLVTLELAVVPQEWEIKPCDAEREKRA